jgi:tryptophan-rich sensory protein
MRFNAMVDIIRAQPPRFRIWHAAAFLAAISALSAMSASKDGVAYWKTLKKSPRTPPAWVFPSVWTIVNVLQVWADLRILNDRDSPDRKTLLGLRATNWLLYGLFTPAFFGAKSPIAGEAVTLAEGVSAGATLALLAKRDPAAAAALAPLALWTAYAAVAGGELAAGNPDRLVDKLRWGGAF